MPAIARNAISSSNQYSLAFSDPDQVPSRTLLKRLLPE
jgi:hypothetical protein